MQELLLFSEKHGRRPGSGGQPWNLLRGFLSISQRHGVRNNTYFGPTISNPSKHLSAGSSILYQYAITIYQLLKPETWESLWTPFWFSHPQVNKSKFILSFEYLFLQTMHLFLLLLLLPGIQGLLSLKLNHCTSPLPSLLPSNSLSTAQPKES